MGAEAVLNLFTAGEYLELLTKVSDINGFTADGVKKREEDEEEIKN